MSDQVIVIIFGFVVGLITSSLGCGWSDDNIPVAIAANGIPIALFTTYLKLMKQKT